MTGGLPAACLDRAPDGALLVRVKAVPGARREGIAGLVGDRLKVKVNAPAEDGRANAAIVALVARAAGVRERRVHVAAGRTVPEKLLRIDAAG